MPLLFKNMYLFNVHVCVCECMSVYHVHTGVRGGQRRVSDPLNLECGLSDVGAGNWTRSSVRAASSWQLSHVSNSLLCQTKITKSKH